MIVNTLEEYLGTFETTMIFRYNLRSVTGGGAIFPFITLVQSDKLIPNHKDWYVV